MLNDATAFFANVKAGLLGPDLSKDEVDGCNAILEAMKGLLLSHAAYALATAYHETNSKMLPVREAYWLSEAWRRKNLRYYPWYGRGYVQLTWQENYKRSDEELHLGGRLLADPDVALELDVAAPVMRLGMVEGWFAGDKQGRHTLSRHLPTRLASLDQMISARRIINGIDDNVLIARYGQQFQAALIAGNWT